MSQVLITGASRGIGRALAEEFAAHGRDLVLVARDAHALANLSRSLEDRHGVAVAVLPADLAQPESREELVRRVGDAGLEIEILINNAGLGLFGPFADSEWEVERRTVEVNVAALTELTKRFLPPMLKRGRGRILNVASTAAFVPGPLMAVYYATKAYVLSFSEAIGNELAGTGVTVTALCPGPTETGFQERARVPADTAPRHGFVMEASAVARVGYRATMRGERLVIPGWRSRLLVQVVRALPRRLATAMIRRSKDRPTGRGSLR